MGNVNNVDTTWDWLKHVLICILPVSWNSSPYKILVIYLVEDDQKMHPHGHACKVHRNAMVGSVWHRKIIALVKKARLHFECCEMTGSSLAQSCDLHRFCTGIVTVIYIFTMNWVELFQLQPSINTKIWVSDWNVSKIQWLYFMCFIHKIL